MARAHAALLAACLLLGSPAMSAGSRDSVDAVARSYVDLALGARLVDPGIVSVADASPGAEARARAAHRDRAALESAAGALLQRLDAITPGADRLAATRWRFLRACIESLRLQLRPADAPALPVSEEVARRYGFQPQFRPLSDYDAALAALDAAMPGEGTLSSRIEVMKQAAMVPADKLEVVIRTAIAECRRRTIAHVSLPPESIELRFPDDAMFPASTTYTGQGHSIVTASRVMPANVDQLLQAACHEVYPGHHVHYLTLDRRLRQGRGWPETGVELQAGPLVPVAEAVAEYGVGLAFPLEDRLAYERDVLFPLAGLKMENPAQWRAYLGARSSILGATSTVARDYLAGTITREQARERFVRYRLQAPVAADQLLKMLPVIGSYVIASDMGWYAIDRALQGRPVDEQWRLLEQIESEPMLLQDIASLPRSGAVR